MSPLSDHDRQLMAATLRRAADRIDRFVGPPGHGWSRAKGTSERINAHIERVALERAAAALRGWADECLGVKGRRPR